MSAMRGQVCTNEFSSNNLMREFIQNSQGLHIFTSQHDLGPTQYGATSLVQYKGNLGMWSLEK